MANEIIDFSHFKMPEGLLEEAKLLLDDDHRCPDDVIGCDTKRREEYAHKPESYKINTEKESYKAYVFCRMFRALQNGQRISEEWLKPYIAHDYWDGIVIKDLKGLASAVQKTGSLGAVDTAVSEMEKHLPQIDSASNAVHVYGYDFRIYSNGAVDPYQLFTVGLAITSFGPHTARRFAEGYKYEKPIRIFSTTPSEWGDFDSLYLIESLVIRLLVGSGTLGDANYNPYNMLMIKPDERDYNMVRHEFMHAVDDYMVSKVNWFGAEKMPGGYYSGITAGPLEMSFKHFLKSAGLTDEETDVYVRYKRGFTLDSDHEREVFKKADVKIFKNASHKLYEDPCEHVATLIEYGGAEYCRQREHGTEREFIQYGGIEYCRKEYVTERKFISAGELLSSTVVGDINTFLLGHSYPAPPIPDEYHWEW